MKDNLLVGIALLAVGWLFLLLVPALVKGVHHLFGREPSRAVDSVLQALDTKEGRARTKAFMNSLFSEEQERRERVLAEAIEMAKGNRDALHQIDFTTKAHGGDLRTIKESMGDMPRLSDAFDRLSASMEAFAARMEHMSEALTRMDEREKERERAERRVQQTDTHPHKRAGDRT